MTAPTAVIVKHVNPCGAAVAEDLATAYAAGLRLRPAQRLRRGGGHQCRAIDEATAEAMVAAAQADVVIAPGYAEGRDRAPRLPAGPTPVCWRHPPSAGAPRVGSCEPWAAWPASSWCRRPAGWQADPANWRVVTVRAPTDAERADAVFAWRVCAHTSSNAVVLAHHGTAWGIGAGQQNRVAGWPDRRGQGRGPGHGRRLRQRRLLPIRRRHPRRSRRRSRGCRSARRLSQRRRSDSRRR